MKPHHCKLQFMAENTNARLRSSANCLWVRRSRQINNKIKFFTQIMLFQRVVSLLIFPCHRTRNYISSIHRCGQHALRKQIPVAAFQRPHQTHHHQHRHQNRQIALLPTTTVCRPTTNNIDTIIVVIIITIHHQHRSSQVSTTVCPPLTSILTTIRLRFIYKIIF